MRRGEGEKLRRGEGEKATSRLSPFFPFLVFLLVFLVYFQVHSYEFIRFDDQDYTFLCPFVKDGLSWANIKAAFCSFRHAAIWMPITYISYMLDISLFGPGMGAHHLVNAAIHAVNSALFFILLCRLFSVPSKLANFGSQISDLKSATPDFRSPFPVSSSIRNSLIPDPRSLIPLLFTLFWALHPMRVEPVAWIAGRKELLCALFVLLGMLAVARVGSEKLKLKSGNTEVSDNSHFSLFTFNFVVTLCCICACMSKPTGMCFPFLAICVAAMMRLREDGSGKREEGIGDGLNSLPAVALAKAGQFSILNFIVAVATGVIAVYSQTHAEGYDVRNLFTAPFMVRALNALKSLGLYVFKTIFPFDLHIDCRWGTPDLPADGWGVIIAAGVGQVLIFGWLFYSMWGRKGIDNGELTRRSLGEGGSTLHYQFFTLLFFLFAIAPTLGVFGSFGRESRADRFMYIPAMALSMLLASCWSAKRRSALLNCVLAFAVLAYLLPTLRLIPTFRNDYTVFSRVLACDPVHPRALSHVASEECARLKDFDSGIRHFRDSLACEWNRDTACQLAFAMATRGRKEDIADIRALGESTGIAKNPESDRKGLMLEALGMAALKEARWHEATVFFAAAVRAPARLYPADDAYARLGVALANGGRHKEAEQVFSSMLRPGARIRESVRAFAARSLEQLSASPSRLMLFY